MLFARDPRTVARLRDDKCGRRSQQWSLPARRVVANAVIDLQFGRMLGGQFLWNRDSSCSDYALLDKIFDDRINDHDVLVDVGSGGGRVINYWLRLGHRGEIFGLEYDPVLASRSARRLRDYPNASILAGDAMRQLPANGTIFYMFNPFGREAMNRFAEALARSIAQAPRETRVLYFNCKHLDVFEADDRFRIESLEMIAHPTGAGQELATITLTGVDATTQARRPKPAIAMRDRDR